jgi:hypothetical protein
VKFLEKVVDAICKAIPSEIRLEDFHIQGKLRLCKVTIHGCNCNFLFINLKKIVEVLRNFPYMWVWVLLLPFVFFCYYIFT